MKCRDAFSLLQNSPTMAGNNNALTILKTPKTKRKIGKSLKLVRSGEECAKVGGRD